MKNLAILFFSLLFFSTLIFAGSKWIDATRFSTPLASAAISDEFSIYALTQGGILYSIKYSDGSSRIVQTLNSPTSVPLQKGRTSLFAGTNDGKIFAYSLRTAELLWQYPKPKTSSGFKPYSDEVAQEELNLADLYYYDGVIYAVFKTRLMGFSESSGAIVFERKLDNGICASADVLGIYVSDGEQVKAFNKDGKIKWSVTTGSLYKACPTPLSSKLYVPTTRGMLLALNSATGQTEWSYPVSGWALSNPVQSDNSVLLGTNQGDVLSINSQTGKLNYKKQIYGPIWATPKILEKDGVQIAIFGTHNKSIIALEPKTGKILFNYQVSDWVDYLSISDDGRTIFAAGRDNTLWALIAYPICTIDYPRTDDVIGQEIKMRGKVFGFSQITSVQMIINSKAYPPKTLQGSTDFEYELDLTQEPLNLVDIQCIATDSQGLRETDHLGYKTQPILSLGARKLNMTIQVYPKNPQPGEKFIVYVRNSQGFDTQDVLLDYLGKNHTISSPQEFSAPAEGTYELIARKSGYYPAQTQFSTRQDFGLLPIVGVVIVVLIIIGAAATLLKKKKKA